MPNTTVVRRLNNLEDGATIFPLNLSHEFIFNIEGCLAGVVANNHKKGYSFGPPDSPNHNIVKKHYPKEDYDIIRRYTADGLILDSWNHDLWNS